MKLGERISGMQLKLSSTERDILAYILANEEFVADSTVSALARQTFSSTSSVIRLTQKLGFEGYGELKYYIKDSLAQRKPATEDMLAITRKDATETLDLIDPGALARVVEQLVEARTVYCFGTGYAQRLAIKDFAKALMLSQKLVYILPGAAEFKGTLNSMTSHDVVLVTSLSGATPGLEDVMVQLNMRGVPIVCLVAQSGGYLEQAADYVMHYVATPATTRLQHGPFYSFVGLTILLDTIVRHVIVALETEAGPASP